MHFDITYKPVISESRKSEIEGFIESVIRMGYEEFEKMKPSIKQYSTFLIEFAMLPKSVLHLRYDEAILEPTRRARYEVEAGKIKGKMKEGKNNFITKRKVDKRQAEEVKYKIVNRYFIVDNRSNAEDEIMIIAIPYQKDQTVKYAESIEVMKSKTPPLFEEFEKKMQEFNGEPDFYFYSG